MNDKFKLYEYQEYRTLAFYKGVLKLDSFIFWTSCPLLLVSFKGFSINFLCGGYPPPYPCGIFLLEHFPWTYSGICPGGLIFFCLLEWGWTPRGPKNYGFHWSSRGLSPHSPPPPILNTALTATRTDTDCECELVV